MSYRRAWKPVGTRNAMFREPVIESTRGGHRAFEREAAAAGAVQRVSLEARLSATPKDH